MGFRDKFRDSPSLGYTAVGGVLILAFIVFYLNFRPVPGGLLAPRWAYDLNTEKLIIAYAGQVAPFDTESGPFSYPGLGEAGAGVDAFVYSCGDPSKVRKGMTVEDLAAIDARIGFLTRMPPFTENDQDKAAAASFDATLISDVTGQKWVRDMTGPAFQLREAALQKCDNGEKPWACVPH